MLFADVIRIFRRSFLGEQNRCIEVTGVNGEVLLEGPRLAKAIILLIGLLQH